MKKEVPPATTPIVQEVAENEWTYSCGPANLTFSSTSFS